MFMNLRKREKSRRRNFLPSILRKDRLKLLSDKANEGNVGYFLFYDTVLKVLTRFQLQFFWLSVLLNSRDDKIHVECFKVGLRASSRVAAATETRFSFLACNSLAVAVILC